MRICPASGRESTRSCIAALTDAGPQPFRFLAVASIRYRSTSPPPRTLVLSRVEIGPGPGGGSRRVQSLTVTEDHFEKTKRLEGLDGLGLDETEQRYMRTLHEEQPMAPQSARSPFLTGPGRNR